jgi:hypothetical protein
MKRILLIVLTIASIFGCSTIESAIGGINSAVSDMGRESSEGMRLGPEFEFSIFYATHMLLVGYGFGDDNFREGKGVTWSVANEKSGEELIVKRALLKDMSDGTTWWYLSSIVDGEDQFYEMLIDKEMNILKVRYRDQDNGVIKEILLEQSGDSDSDAEGDSEMMDPHDYGKYSTGQETIKTKAGSFKTEHLIYDDNEYDHDKEYDDDEYDDDKKEYDDDLEYKYEYWLTDKVPGGVVKYIYENISENETMSGEVIDIRSGYKTQLESY